MTMAKLKLRVSSKVLIVTSKWRCNMPFMGTSIVIQVKRSDPLCFRLHETPAAHYESAMTRQFLGGRTETIRSCSVESVEFAKAMLNKNLSEKQLIKYIKKAIKAHKDYTVDVSIVVRRSSGPLTSVSGHERAWSGQTLVGTKENSWREKPSGASALQRRVLQAELSHEAGHQSGCHQMRRLYGLWTYCEGWVRKINQGSV